MRGCNPEHSLRRFGRGKLNMMTRRLSGALIAAFVVSTGGSAFGEIACPDASNSEEARTFAREHFGAAQEAYDAGRPLAALEHYRCSYEQVPHPDTLYNIGVLAEGIGRLEDARDAYREYLDRYQDSEARADIQTRLERVEARIPDEPDTPTESPNPQNPQPAPQPQMPLQPIQFQPAPQQLQSLQPQVEPQPYATQPQPTLQPQVTQPAAPVARPRRHPARIAAIVTMPVGLVMAALGGAVYGAAVVRNNEFRIDIDDQIVSRNWLEDEAAAGQRLERVGWAMIGVGGAVVVTSIVLFAVFPRFRPLPGAETASDDEDDQTEQGTESTPSTETPAVSPTPAQPTSRLRRFTAIAAPLVLDDGGLGLSLAGRF
jgi:hypothetical protein